MRERRLWAVVAAAAVAVAVGVAAAGAATAGTPPKRVDKNWGWTMSKVNVHNILWDSDWDAHNSIKKGDIHSYLKRLAGSSWISGASQYGVKSMSLVETKGPGGLCDKSPGSSISTTKLLLWVSCMILPGTGVQIPSPRLPVSNDLYVIYTPSGTKITDNLTLPSVTLLGKTFGGQTIVNRSSCDDYGAYHAFSLYLGGVYPIAIIPVDCAGSLDELTAAVSHEIIEAATDPLPGAGWIDTSIPNTSPTYARLSAGEVADICTSAGAVPTALARRGAHDTAVYWSNSAGSCVG